jgi:hypothetical protein
LANRQRCGDSDYRLGHVEGWNWAGANRPDTRISVSMRLDSRAKSSSEQVPAFPQQSAFTRKIFQRR